MESIIDSIDDALSGIESSADFAFCKPVLESANIGLNIKGLGAVGLPVSQRDVEALIAQSKQSPFGFKSETRLDLNVRKTWELNSDQVKFEHPFWPVFLQNCVNDASKALAVPEGAKAQLNKLLIYEEDGMFDKHKDTEKADGMFGTMVLVLPCEHSGGDLILQHAGKTKTFKSAPISKYGISCMAWYGDVTHQVKKVTSGYRVVLTFNLIHDSRASVLSAQTRCTGDGVESQLSQIFLEWKKVPEDEAYDLIAYQLEHEYTEANIQLSYLKGLDKVQGDIICAAAKASGINVYLASMEKTVEGGAEESDDYEWFHQQSEEHHEIVDICDESIYLEKIFDINGHEVAARISIEQEHVVQGENAFQEVDEEEYEGWTGNEGASATHFYRSMVMVLIPPAKENTVFFQAKLNEGQGAVEDYLAAMVIRWKSGTAKEKILEKDRIDAFIESILQGKLKRLVKDSLAGGFSATERYGGIKLSDSLMKLMTESPLTPSNSELLFKVLINNLSAQPQTWLHLGKAIRIHCLPTERETLSKNLNPCTLRATVDALVAFNNGLEGVTFTDTSMPGKPIHELIHFCVESTIQSRMQSNYLPDKVDADAIVVLFRWFPDLIDSMLFPFVEKHANRADFALRFLCTIDTAVRKGAVEGLDTQIASLRSKTLGGLNLVSTHSQPAGFTGYNYSTTFTRPTLQLSEANTVSGIDLADVFLQCAKHNEQQLMTKVEVELCHLADQKSENLFKATINLFVEHLASAWKKLTRNDDKIVNASTPKLIAQRTVVDVLKKYLLLIVGPEPPTYVPTRQRAPVSCTCNDCRQLNQFLTSPTEHYARFCMAQFRRKHLEQLLVSTGCSWSTDRNGSPQTLVVRKGKDPGLQVGDAWRARRKRGETFIDNLRKAGLSTLLPSEYIGDILQTGLLSSRPLGEIDGNARQPLLPALGPGAGAKRSWNQRGEEEAQVIDLT